MAPPAGGDLAQFQCWNCKEYGHLAKDCTAAPAPHLRALGATGAEVVAHVYRLHMEEEDEEIREEAVGEEHEGAPEDDP